MRYPQVTPVHDTVQDSYVCLHRRPVWQRESSRKTRPSPSVCHVFHLSYCSRVVLLWRDTNHPSSLTSPITLPPRPPSPMKWTAPSSSVNFRLPSLKVPLSSRFCWSGFDLFKPGETPSSQPFRPWGNCPPLLPLYTILKSVLCLERPGVPVSPLGRVPLPVTS